MQRITLESEISYVISEKEINEIRAEERKKVISEMLSKLRPCVDEAIRTMEVSHVYDMTNILAKYKKEICHENN